MKPRFFLSALGVAALLSLYVGCGGSDAAPDDGGSTRKGSTSKSGKGGTSSKGGSGGASAAGKGGAAGGELVIDEQEPDTCSHDACDPGLPLPVQCSPCVGTVCNSRASCCDDHWDDECTHLARGVAACACDDGGIGTGVGGSSTGGAGTTGTGGAQSSGKGGTGGTTGSGGAQTSGKGGTGGTSGTGSGGASTGAGAGGTTSNPVPSCSHTPCEEGGPLKTKCSLCAAQVCAQKASCCLDAWTADCLAVAATVPGCSCAPPNGGAGSTGTAGSSSGKGGSAGSGAGSSGGASSGKGGTNGSGSNGSGGANGAGNNGAGGTNGSGNNGSGNNGSGGTNGAGNNGSGSNGSGSSSSSGGNGAGAENGGGNGGQAGFIVGGAGGESGGCHSPCEEGEALSQLCGIVPFGICLYDPFCCDKDNGSWNAACVGYATKLFICPKKEDDRDTEASCDHDVCTAGGPLKADCDDCSAKVCAKDAYCCDTKWDGLCMGKASELCQKCNENAGMCEHAVCGVGKPLKPSCDPCVAKLCEDDDYCCTVAWDALCVNLAVEACDCGKTCDHDACTVGGPLKQSCSDTTKDICAADNFCCSIEWDNICVDLAATAGACGDKCSHDVCETGAALQAECGECEKKICEKDPTCCTFSHGWDIVCQAEAGEICGKNCNP